MPQPQQPFLHDLVCLVAAPTQVWSGRDGGIESGPGAHGILHADIRMVSALELRVAGRPAEHIATASDSDGVRFSFLLRGVADIGRLGADPPLRLDRERRARPGQVTEDVTMSSVLDQSVDLAVTLRVAADLVPIEVIKVGGHRSPRMLTPTADGGTWTDGTVTARLLAEGARIDAGADDLTLSWTVTVPPRGAVVLGWRLELQDAGAVVVTAGGAPSVPDLVERAVRLAGPATEQDRRLRPWVERSFADLDALRMATRDRPDQPFYAAGAPWYLTLFGRDSILSARMMLAVDPELAAGTLRTLAGVQGRGEDPDAAEQPGKIMHELRRDTFTFGEVSLPPLYYGTIDATPLWICLLHDAWRAGLADEIIQGLLPALEGALAWLIDYGDADGDGFLEYFDTTGHGLANQGWKDSADAVRFHDGRQAVGPVALCEVQGYAYEAAAGGAALLDAFGMAGGERYRGWATALAEAFRRRFWCERDGRRFPALALDGSKQRVDSLTSNIGHLLGTGLLDAEEERLVAELVSGPELDSGLGLRTMAATDGGYAPLSYHCGSVWPHDTAIVIAGLIRSGLTSYATGLVEGMLRASVSFDQRLPELWSGEGRPVPYPMACRPQAWSAAAVVPVLVAWRELGR